MTAYCWLHEVHVRKLRASPRFFTGRFVARPRDDTDDVVRRRVLLLRPGAIVVDVQRRSGLCRGNISLAERLIDDDRAERPLPGVSSGPNARPRMIGIP